MIKIETRKYQQETLDDIESNLAFDDKVVVAVAGGGGKSILIAELCKKYMLEKQYVVVLTNMSALIPQLARALDSFSVKYNVVKAGSHSYDKDAYVSLVMEQSFHENKRNELKLKCDIEIKDEGNIGIGGKRYNDIQEHLEPKQIIYFTASPLDEKGYLMHGITKDQVLMNYDIKALTDMKFLTPLRYFVPKWAESIDYSDIKLSGNDYSSNDISKVINTSNNLKFMVESMNLMNAKNRKTLVFASSIEHALSINNALQENGYSSQIVHSEQDKKINEKIINLFKGIEEPLTKTLLEEHKPEPIMTLVSVMSLAIGFDAPEADLLVLCRKTRIFRLYYQIVARLTRLSPGKKYGDVLDLAQCVSNLGFADEPIELINVGDKKSLDKYKDSKKSPVVKSMISNEPTEITKEAIDLQMIELKKKENDISNLNMQQLTSIFEISTNVNVISHIFYEINLRVRALSYKQSSIEWTASTWNQMIIDFPAYSNRIIKTMKTRAKNITKDKKKTGSLHYFPEFLRSKSPYALEQRIQESGITEDDIPY